MYILNKVLLLLLHHSIVNLLTSPPVSVTPSTVNGIVGNLTISALCSTAPLPQWQVSSKQCGPSGTYPLALCTEVSTHHGHDNRKPFSCRSPPPKSLYPAEDYLDCEPLPQHPLFPTPPPPSLQTQSTLPTSHPHPFHISPKPNP